MDKINRKFKKLVKSPKKFFKDMGLKYIEKYIKHYPIKYKGNFHYTVVSAVYNTGKYLDDYFSSLVHQSLNFKKHIYLILVDDGSTDNSAEIIEKWRKKHPNNIMYLYKENGGIASARNLGLQAVKTEWVTFIDSDDKIGVNYFKEIDKVLSSERNIGLAVGNLYFYFEQNKSLRDNHALRYRFSKPLSIVPVKELNENINLFVTVSFFRTQTILENTILFDSRVKPNFEDGKFIADYLLCIDDKNVAYVKKAIFHYRKRSNKSSTIDTSWLKKEKYSDLFIYGYIPMLKAYISRYGKVPKNIQYTIIYEMVHHVRHLESKLELNILSKEEKHLYYRLILSVMSYIDPDFIDDFNILKSYNKYKVHLVNIKSSVDYIYTI